MLADPGYYFWFCYRLYYSGRLCSLVTESRPLLDVREVDDICKLRNFKTFLIARHLSQSYQPIHCSRCNASPINHDLQLQGLQSAEAYNRSDFRREKGESYVCIHSSTFSIESCERRFRLSMNLDLS